MGRPLGARIRIRTVFVDYSTAGKCPSFLSRRIHPLRHRIRAFSESSTKKNAGAAKAAPTAAFLGTGLYGFAYLQTALPSEIIALLGLVCCGAGYYATTLLIYCELAKTKRLVMAIGALSASLILKTIVGSELSTALTSSAQVVFASILPWVSFACLEVAQALRHITLSRSIPLSPTF